MAIGDRIGLPDDVSVGYVIGVYNCSKILFRIRITLSYCVVLYRSQSSNCKRFIFYFHRTFVENTTDQGGTVSFALGADETYKKRSVQRTSN